MSRDIKPMWSKTTYYLAGKIVDVMSMEIRAYGFQGYPDLVGAGGEFEYGVYFVYEEADDGVSDAAYFA